MLKGAIRSRQLADGRNRMMADIADRRRRPGQPDPRRGRAALRPGPRARPGWSPRAPARSRPRSARRPSEHRVPMVADIPLARRSARACEIGQEIPAELFAAVAQVLAFVIAAAHAAASAAGSHRTPAIAGDLPEVSRSSTDAVAARSLRCGSGGR